MGIITLNPGQAKIKQEAVNWFKNSSEQVFQIEGPAGSGKTFLIFEILKELGLHPTQILPMAYTGQASIVMRTRGFSTARSIHSSLYETVVEYDTSNIANQFGLPIKKNVFKKRTYIDPRICLFFIDEGYMVPDYMLNDLLSFGVKILVCGDSNQLPPVGGKPCFFTSGKIHRLTELMRRSADSPIIYLATRAMKGEPIHAGIYGNDVLVVNDNEFNPSMIGFADSIICGTNRTRETMNAYVRQVAGFDSDLPRFGERMICRNNNWSTTQDGIALCNGLTGTVVSQPDASCFNGKTFTMNFRPDLANTIFFDVPVNYEYYKAGYDERQNIKNGNMKYMTGEMFEYAYAISTWLAQGSEYPNVLYIEEFMRPQIQNALNYTAITRAKKKLIYVKKVNKYIYIPGLQNIIK